MRESSCIEAIEIPCTASGEIPHIICSGAWEYRLPFAVPEDVFLPSENLQ